MWEELWEVIGTRWGLLGLGAVILVAGPGRKYVRQAAKRALKAGLSVSDAAREFVAEVKEQGSDLIAEVQSERKEAAEQQLKPAEDQHTEKKVKKAAE
jgi:hypothetical protein